MRYTPEPQYYSSATFRAGPGRPPLDELPADIAKLLEEHDRVGAQRSEAESAMRLIADQSEDIRAAATDAAAAKDAARAHRPLPKPVAVPALVAARDLAVRQSEAEDAALVEVVTDLHNVLADWRTQHREAALKAWHARVVRVTELASELVDAVEDTVKSGAVADWLDSSVYYTRADIWAADAVPRLESHWGLARSETTPISVREIITNTVATVLEKETS
jgi:hypothetical protein